jgi:hypothetical protein
MNERTIAAAERALIDFLKKTRRERDYFRGRLIKADNLPAPDQHMISAAMSKVDWYAVQIHELEGELEMLREELGLTEDEDMGKIPHTPGRMGEIAHTPGRTDQWEKSDTNDVGAEAEPVHSLPALKETARWRREKE